MANPEHLAILKQGVKQWNKWRVDHPPVKPDLGEAQLGERYLFPEVGEGIHEPEPLGNADLSGARLSVTELSGADLREANLQGADLRGANLFGADLRTANISRADLRRADLSRANLGRADLDRADLGGAQLRVAKLNSTSLAGANLREASLSEADCSWALFRGSDLTGAELDRADLTGARLSGADLNGANLTAANLGGTDFSRANLVGTDFSHVLAQSTRFTAVDLSVAKGLETVRHYAPSTVGIDTIYKSRGKIPEVFLRGCGVPDEFIAYIGSMVGRPIEFYSCFISYSTKDQQFAERLHADLQAKAVRYWFAPHDIKGGRKIHEQLDEAIRLHDKLLLILSEHSMSSNWVKTEIANAREREKREGKQLLFPITLVPFEAIKKWKLFDADIGIDSAREIREYFIPDFSNWKEHDSYQTAFQRLVKDLKAGAGG